MNHIVNYVINNTTTIQTSDNTPQSKPYLDHNGLEKSGNTYSYGICPKDWKCQGRQKDEQKEKGS